MGNRKNILRLVSIVIALAMIVPGIVLTQQSRAVTTGLSPEAQSGPTTYAWVDVRSNEQANAVKAIGANIVSLRGIGAYVKVTEGQRAYLSQHFVVNEIPERTIVNLEEQGFSFDSQVGYDLAAEWRNTATSEYLVQFVAPTETAWNDGVEALSGKILREIGNNLIVVKMSPAQKAMVEGLDYVQWVGAYEPGFKMDKNIAHEGVVKITIDAYGITDVPAIISKLSEFGATEIEDTQYGSVVCSIAASALPYVAKLDTVKLVWNLPEMKAMNNVGGRIVQAHDVWVSTVSNLPQDITGAGQTIHIQDTGLDATHRDFINGPLGNRIVYRESATDAEYHGTHCMGIAVGNGYDMEAYLGLSTTNRIYDEMATSNPAGRPDRMGFAGRAPEAFITANAGFSTTEWQAAFTTYSARVFSNSWGPSTVNNDYSSAADNFMVTNPTGLVYFAAGNDGPRHNTVSGEGNGKLAMAVGATENMRAIDFDTSDDYNQLVGFSSRGPVSDGRIKPDVCEIGTAVYSTLSDDSAAENTGYEVYDTINIVNSDTGDALGDYISLQGTSMACPAAAGDTLLVRDYLQDVIGMPTANIHANLLKTLVIHGAEDMGLGYPSYDQGWGRINVRNSICPAFPNVIQWFHHTTGIATGTWSARVDGGLTTWVIDNTVPLKVTLVHWDAAGSGELTYDLDLVVTSPSGVRYEGNAFKEAWSTPCTGSTQWGGTYTQFPSWVGGTSYDFDEGNDGGDDENNVEMFRVQEPEKGQWNIQVVWKESTARPFSIAITGGMNASADFNAVNNAYKVNMLLDMPRVVPERDDFGEGTVKCAPDGSVIVPFWVNNGGTTNDAYTISAPILPSGFTATFYPGSTLTVNANKRLHGYARIMVGSAVTAGTYTLAFKALSNNDASAPIAQATIKFQVDVVTTKTPSTVKVAGTSAHEAAPSFVSWFDGTNYNVGCVYTQDDRYGDRVYFKLSTNGGTTWGTPVVVSDYSWSPGFVTIERATTGTYAGRLGIAYNAWNPDGYNNDTADTRNSYIKFHYSTNNGASWSAAVNAWALGTGVSVGNTYRTLNLNWASSVNQFYITLEVMGYADTTNYAQDDIACVGKASTDGGATWLAQTRIDPGVTGMYYFFPSVETDALGNLCLYFYQRDSSDAAQDRDATYMYYNGAWGVMQLAWDTTDNLMMPQTGMSTQGTNSNRAYGAFLKGANTDGDRELYLIWTDNPNAGTPTFSTNYGPYGPIMSDHDYGMRFVYDLEWSNNYLYVFGHRNVKYDPYGQPNLLTVYDNDFTVTPVPSVDYLTLDSYVHGKQRAVATTNGGLAKVFVAQNVMSYNILTRGVGHDIVGMHVYNGWQSATDTIGPVTEYLSADKIICNAGDLVTVVANVNEWTTGGNNIRGASYKTSVSNVTWVTMQSLDGAFNSPAEAVVSSTTPINTAGWTTGWKWIFVRGQDNSAAQNWGAEVGIRIYVNPQVTAAATLTGPTGTDNVQAITFTYMTEGIPTSVNIYRTTNTVAPYTWTLCGNDATPADFSYGYTLPAGSATYGFVASAVGGSTTELSPPSTATAPEIWYTYDVTAPAAPTGFTVERWGPTAQYGATVTQARYMRGVASEAVVNGLTAYSLGTAQSTTAANWAAGTNWRQIYIGITVFKRTSAGVETELTTGLSAEATATATGMVSATWTPPQTTLNAGDSIVVKVYADITDPPTTIRATFTTEQINSAILEANQWTVSYYLTYSNPSRWYWGTTTYNTNIAGFQYTPMVARDPLQDNTLNWTASASGDVASYNIYRDADGTGVTYSLLTSVPVGTNTYLDSLKGSADTTLWYYRVRAVDLAGNEETNVVGVQELGGAVTPDPYEISLTGKAVGSWVFISFPSGLTGSIDTLLTDLGTGGDGLTTWDVAKWYNPQTPADLWKTYRTAGTGNDMPTVNNQMGFWIHLTANGGDQLLTLSNYAAIPASTVITLYAGWNLVGYPSMTDRSGSTTPAAVTIISVYSASAAYTDYVTKATATLHHGNAYFMYATAGTTWTVTNP